MLILELLWWVGWAWFAAWIALPLVAVPLLGVVPGFVVWAVLAPWSALLGMATLHRMLPNSEPGTFRLPGDGGSVRWALKAWAPSLYLTLFQPLCFTSRFFQLIVLRAFGARLASGAWLTSRTIVREPHHVRVGRRSLIGEYAHLICSYQPRPGVLIVARIVIGDDNAVDRRPDRHRRRLPIGAGTTVYNAARIGRHVFVGKNCLVPSGAVLADGARIPDGTVVTSQVHQLEAAS